MRIPLFVLFFCNSLAMQVVGAHATESWKFVDGKGMLGFLSDGYELKAAAGGRTEVFVPNVGLVSNSEYIYVLTKGADIYRCLEGDYPARATVIGCYHLVPNQP